jgi:hypothetical protein
MINLILALLITIIVEFLIFYLFFRKSPLKLFIYSVLINSFTLPLATYIYIYILNNFLIAEIMVVLVESVLIMLLMEIKYKKSVLISIVANLVSAIIGLTGLI